MTPKRPAVRKPVPSSQNPAGARAKKNVALIVDVPSLPDGEDVEVAQRVRPRGPPKKTSFVAPRVYRDDDVDEAGRQGWISGPCDCCLSVWATLGDAIEGGAEQFVGFALLMLSGAFTYMLSGGYRALWSEGETDTGRQRSTPPSPPSLLEISVHSSSAYAQAHPATFVAALLGSLFAIGLMVLFEEDFRRALADMRLRWMGYRPLEKPNTPAHVRMAPGAAAIAGGRPQRAAGRFMRERTLKQELHKAVDRAEELELQLIVNRRDAQGSSTENELQQDEVAARHEQTLARLHEQQARRGSLQVALSNAAVASSPELRKSSTWQSRPNCWARFASSTFLAVFQRSLNGLVVIWLYFADIISDVEVMVLLYESGMLAYAAIAGALLVLQFFAVYLRVLPYLHSTFGRGSAMYCFFLWLGFPFGMLGLDVLMFLEPLGLLRVLPLPDSLRQFVPAYKATRIIAEVMLESLPQCLLQSYILITVMHHVNAHHESTSEDMLMHSHVDGLSFSEILPRSITISTITMLKTWIELVYSAREAGISVRTKAAQLWHVGHGLPLDALKKGSFAEWSCAYHLSNGEVMPLLDALIKNSSLSRLHLAKAGLEWAGPDSKKERSGAPLIEAMITSAKACSDLQWLVVGPSGFEIPIGRLRKGGRVAREALGETRMLSALGPRRLEILLMSDVLRKNRRTAVAAMSEVEGSAGAVAALMEEAKRGELSRAAWESRVADMMVAGETRRAHFKSLISAAMLHDVGFNAKECLAVDYTAQELFEGGFEAQELLRLGYSHAALHELGYTPRGLKRAGLSPADLRTLGCSAASLKGADFTASELRNARYVLTELKEAGYAAADILKGGGCTAADLRAVGYSAAELKACIRPEQKVDQAHLQWAHQLQESRPDPRGLLSVAMLREGGYSAAELREAGFECRIVHKAGYDAAEATKAKYSLAQLVSAGFAARDLRRAGHLASGLRKLGLTLAELRHAEYTPTELQDAGFDAKELKQAGTSLTELRKANTPVPTLRAAGYTANQLRQHGYTAGELAVGGYNAKELRGFRDNLKSEANKNIYAGFSAKELRDGSVAYSAAELQEGGYTAAELRAGGWTAAELKAKGFGCAALYAGGYVAKEMYKSGFTLPELQAIEGGAAATSLKLAGVPALQMRRAGFIVNQLFRGGYDAAELCTAGYTRLELKEGGFDPKQLAATGCTLGELLEQLEFTVPELRLAGYMARDLYDCEDDAFMRLTHDDGISNAELLAAGFPKREVDALGKSAASLRASGHSAAELRSFGFELRELRAGGFPWRDCALAYNATHAELVDAGFKNVDKSDPVFMSA